MNACAFAATLRAMQNVRIGALVALLHDVLITIGAYSLFGRELSLVSVGAVLTIGGYSINDTIVIFDRIREDLKLGVKGSFRDMMNHALNQTLSRTIITSGTVLIATLCLKLCLRPNTIR